MDSKRRFPEYMVSADDQEAMRRKVKEAHKLLMDKFGRYQKSVPGRGHNLLLAYFIENKKK